MRPAFTAAPTMYLDTRMLTGCVPRSADPEAQQRDQAAAAAIGARQAAEAADPMRLAMAGGGDFRPEAVHPGYAEALAHAIHATGHPCAQVRGFFRSAWDIAFARVVCADPPPGSLYLISVGPQGEIHVRNRLQ